MSVANDSITRIPTAPAAVSPWTDSSQRQPWLQLGTIRNYQWNRLNIPIEHLPQPLRGLRILHLSDLHFRDIWFEGYDQILAGISDNPPDVILITGDFVEARADHRPALPMLQRFLTRLTSRLGTFGILGNHDGDLLAPRLADMNVTLINGHLARLASDDAATEIVGIPGISRRDLTPAFIERVGTKPPRTVRIVLSHYPDAIGKLTPTQPDLVLSGHTHGGQICLPNGFALLTHDRLPRRMCKGLHRICGTWLLVSRGMGFAAWRVRAFCPAEVLELVLTDAIAADEG